MKSRVLLPLVVSCVAILHCMPSNAIPISEPQEIGLYKDIFSEELFREILLGLPGDIDFAPIVLAIQAGDFAQAKSLLAPILVKMPENAAVLELQGTIRFNAGDLNGAAESFRKTLSISPGQVSTMVSLGLVELALGNLSEARELLQKVTGKQVANALAHKYLARIAVQTDDPAQAEVHYLAAIHASPVDNEELYSELAMLYFAAQRYLDVQKLLEPVAQEGTTTGAGIPLLLAQAYLKLGEHKAARRQLNVAGKHPTNNTQIIILEAGIDRAQGKLDAATEKLRRVLKGEPNNVQAHYELGLTLAQSGDSKQALTELEIAAASPSLQGFSQIHIDIARLRLAGGEADKAIAVLEPMAKGDSTPDPVTLQLLSEAYARAGRADAALMAVDTLTREYPQFAPGFLARAAILDQLGRSEEARAAARLATQNFPEWPTTWQRYAGLEIAAGHPETAEKVLENGLERHPDNDALRFQLAKAYQDQDKRSAAETLYRRVLDSKPDDVGSLNNLAMVLAQDEEKRAEALQLVRRAQQLVPSSPAVEDTLGWVLYLNGEYAEAEHWLLSAISKLPEDPNVLCRLGIVFGAQGAQKKARTALNRCLPLTTEPQLHKLATTALASAS